MSRSMMPILTATIALIGAAPAPGSAQALRPTTPSLSLAGAPASGALKPAYHVRLTSTWPQESGEGGCRNGGEESVEGTLTRTADGRFIGTLSRRTTLLFCGAHGNHQDAETATCELALTGLGDVSAIHVGPKAPAREMGRAAARCGASGASRKAQRSERERLDSLSSRV